MTMNTHVNVPEQPKDLMYEILYRKPRNGDKFTVAMAQEFYDKYKLNIKHGVLIMYAKILVQPVAKK